MELQREVGSGARGGERTVELRPQPRVVGPGRREREYLERIAALNGQRAQASEATARLARELDLAQRLERGCQRHLDRLETRLTAERERFQHSEEAQKRLLVALGAIQRENELLRQRLGLRLGELQAAAAPRLGPRPRSFWRRLLPRSRA